MTYLIWVLRLIHILGGVFWVGGVLTMAFFVGPAVGAVGEAGQKFMAQFVSKSRFPQRITAAAILTILAGISLYWIDSGGLTSAWIKSGAGIGFTIGAIFGLVGFVFGVMTGRNMGTMSKIAAEAQGKPSPEQVAQIQSIQKQQVLIGSLNSYSLILAVIFMALARYLH